MSVDLEALYPKLVNLLLDPVFVVDEFGQIVFISEACERLLGYTAEEMVGTQVLHYIHPDDLERTRVAAGRVMSGVSHIDFENRYVRKDGGIVHILWSARWSEEDRVRIAVARDVTALRRADQTRDALYRISQAAHAAENLRALCKGVQSVIGELFSTDHLYLAFYDAAENVLSFPDWSDDRADAWVDGPLQPDSAIAEVLGAGQALLTTQDPARPGLGLGWKDAPHPGSANWLGVPLVFRDTVLGAVVIESQSADEHYSAADLELLQFVATQVATAVERKRVEEHLRFMAHHDPLTGLTNRSLFYDRLETALRLARRNESNESKVALLYLDLNGFKQVNDSKGHEMGDRMLCEVARRLELCTREADTVARMGGDEFTVLLTGVCDAASVDTMVHKIRDVMAVPMDLGDETFHMSCSIGTALYPDDGVVAEQLLRKADASMYMMKRSS